MGVMGKAQTVTTDKADYQPGETVVITGTGWTAGETVKLYIEKEPPVTDPVFLSGIAVACCNILYTPPPKTKNKNATL